MHWFRFYHEFVDDPKIAMMTESDQLLWVKALCLASANEKNRGVIALSDEEICWKLRITVESWKHAIDKFRAKGMVEHCEEGYRIINWDKRQFKSDSSAKRVAKHRAKNRPKKRQKQNAETLDNVTDQPCNVTVTPPDQIRSDPDPDSDSDPDPDSEQRQIQNRSHTHSDPDPESASEKTSFSGRQELTGSQQTESRFTAQQLPKWRAGPGPNDWHEPAVDAVLGWLNEIRRAKREPDAKRADAIAYISRREYPGHSDYPALVARIDELLAAKTQAPGKSWRQRLREEKLAKASHET